MLEVCLCKPAIHKLKILGGVKFEYYKSMGRTTKKGRGGQIFKVQWGKQKGSGHDFWFKFNGVKNLAGNYVLTKFNWDLKLEKNLNWIVYDKICSEALKVVSTTFLLVCFLNLKESTCETRKCVFYYTLKATVILDKIKV